MANLFTAGANCPRVGCDYQAIRHSENMEHAVVKAEYDIINHLNFWHKDGADG